MPNISDGMDYLCQIPESKVWYGLKFRLGNIGKWFPDDFTVNKSPSTSVFTSCKYVHYERKRSNETFYLPPDN